MLPALIPLLGAGISAASSFFGARENRQATEAANLQNSIIAQRGQDISRAEAEATRNMAAADNAATRALNLQINQDNIALQREFAQHGIRWKADDAKAAGLHPMAALGGAGAAFSPVAHVSGGSIPSTPVSSPSANIVADTSMGNAMSSMGQDISRAISATAAVAERNDAYTQAMQAISLEKGTLENDLLKSQIARARQSTGPAMPVSGRYLVDGQGSTASGTSLVVNKPLERTPGDPNNVHAEPGALTDVGYARTASGGYAPVPSKDVKERIEDNLIQETLWAFRNNLLPSLLMNQKPPPVAPKEGHGWVFDPFTQEYRQRKKIGRFLGTDWTW